VSTAEFQVAGIQHPGNFAEIKTLVKITPTAWADGLVSSAEKTVHDFQPRLGASNGWITDKPEGVAILRIGRTFVVTDNDGMDDWNGETWFLDLGGMLERTGNGALECSSNM